MSSTALSLTIDSVAQLGLHLSPRTSGLLLAAPPEVEAGAAIALEIVVDGGGAEGRCFALEGHVAQLDPPAAFEPPPGLRVVRVELERESWKRLFVYVCRTPWRRRADLEPPRPGSTDTRRWRLELPVTCAVSRTGAVCAAILREVSERGAFLGLERQGLLEPGDPVRFGGELAPSEPPDWFVAQVRWCGVKGGHPGVGLEVEPTNPHARSRWTTRVLALAVNARRTQ